MRTLVLDGGGQLGCFVWGVLVELYRLGLQPNFFDRYIATSAGVFNAAYFVTEQIEEGLRIWKEHLPKGFWKWNRNDMAYLEKILREIEPLRLQLLQCETPEVFATLCNAKTLSSEIISLNTSHDLVKVMLASAAMPFLTGPIYIHGEAYYDAGLVSQPPLDHVTFGKDSETWVIISTPRGYLVKAGPWKVLSACAWHDRGVRNLLLNCPRFRNRNLGLLENSSAIKVIQPQQTLPLSWRSRDIFAIAHTIELGKKAAQQFAREQKW